MRISDWSSDVCSSDLDPKIARTLEPRAPHPTRRLAAIAKLIDAGVPTQVNISPIIPAITDHEIEAIMAAAAEAGAIRASYILMRLPFEVAPLFRAWLAAHYPDRADKVMHMVQERSEEHTSELQSLMRISYAVSCLKKKTQQRHTSHPTT